MKQTTTQVLSVLLFCLASHAAEQTQQKPNVLFIAIDDLNDWTDMLKGNPQAKTPHMDQLASKGMVFANGPLRGACLWSFTGCHHEPGSGRRHLGITSTRVP